MSEVPETYRVFARTLETVATRLTSGWVFDPWLCSKGYPILTGENTCYWVLVNPLLLDTPEKLTEAYPFMQLEAEVKEEKPLGYGTVFIPFKKNEDATEQWREKGYVLLHKDHADVVGPDKEKGTILTLVNKPMETETDG